MGRTMANRSSEGIRCCCSSARRASRTSRGGPIRKPALGHHNAPLMQDLIAKATTLLEALPYIQRFRGATFVVKYGGSFMDSPDAAARRAVARDIVFLAAVQIHPVVVHGRGRAITRAMESAGLKPAVIQGQPVTDEATMKGVTPVVSPVARGEDGRIYNCDADVAAAQTAIALNARRLVFMSDVPGLLRDPKEPATLITHLRTSEVETLKRQGIVDQGMIPKV